MKDYNGFINLSFPENDWCVYTISSTKSEDYNFYIGVTEDYKQRCKEHKNNRNYNHKAKELYNWINQTLKEGHQIIFRVIYSNLSEKQAFDKEIEVISLYKSYNLPVFNKTPGGKNPYNAISPNLGRKASKETIEKLRISHKGQKCWAEGRKMELKSIQKGIETKKIKFQSGWNNPKKKKIFKYNKEGTIVAEYKDKYEASTQNNLSPSHIIALCNSSKTHKNQNCIFSYKNNKINNDETTKQ